MSLDQDSNEARLSAHRKASSMWPNGRPETHVERQLRVALGHLERVLNGCRTAAEQQEADTEAREFLRWMGQ